MNQPNTQNFDEHTHFVQATTPSRPSNRNTTATQRQQMNPDVLPWTVAPDGTAPSLNIDLFLYISSRMARLYLTSMTMYQANILRSRDRCFPKLCFITVLLLTIDTFDLCRWRRRKVMTTIAYRLGKDNLYTHDTNAYISKQTTVVLELLYKQAWQHAIVLQ